MVTEEKEDDLAAFAERLNEALDAIGMPPKYRGRQTKLARLCGVSQKGARKWLEGLAMPEDDNLTTISRKVKRSKAYLRYGDGQPDNRMAASTESEYQLQGVAELSRHPVLRWEQVPDWQDANAMEYRTVPENKNVSENAFFLRVEGDAMAAEFPAGGWILVDPDHPASAGDLVVALPASSATPLFRELQIESGRATLVPRNPRYPIEQCQEIIGRVMEFSRQY